MGALTTVMVPFRARNDPDLGSTLRVKEDSLFEWPWTYLRDESDGGGGVLSKLTGPGWPMFFADLAVGLCLGLIVGYGIWCKIKRCTRIRDCVGSHCLKRV
jgi:hypothetical protein